MTAVYKEPGKDPKIIDVGNSLEALQFMVHGYIEKVPVFGDICLLCNEEALLKNMPYNLTVMLPRDRQVHVFGPLLLVGVDADGFYNLPEPEWWIELIGLGGGENG